MATKKPAAKKSAPKKGTKQTDASDSELGKKPTSTPSDGGPVRPADSPYAS